MAAKATRKRSRTKAPARRAKQGMSPQQRAIYGEIRQGIGHLERSIAEIQRGLRKAEKKIEADARARIRALKTDARAQLRVLKSKRRDASDMVKALSTAASTSWQEIKQSADAILADARGTAASVVDRLRMALHR